MDTWSIPTHSLLLQRKLHLGNLVPIKKVMEDNQKLPSPRNRKMLRYKLTWPFFHCICNSMTGCYTSNSKMFIIYVIHLFLQPAEMSLEEIESRLGSLIQADTITQLKSAVWKERLEGLLYIFEPLFGFHCLCNVCLIRFVIIICIICIVDQFWLFWQKHWGMFFIGNTLLFLVSEPSCSFTS